MKKGFTLIELLAVIVILAVIALIATPIIINIIEDAQKNAALQSANGYVRAVNYKIANSMLNSVETLDGDYVIGENALTLNANNVNDIIGSYTIDKNIVLWAGLCINNYSIDYYNGKSTISRNNYCSGEVIETFEEPEGEYVSAACTDSTLYANTTSFKIKTVEDLVCLSNLVNSGSNFSGKTVHLVSDIDFNSDDSYTNPSTTAYQDINEDNTTAELKTEVTTGKGFKPIGNYTNTFAGTLEGYAFTISNLMINRPSSDYVGLFGYVSGRVNGLVIRNANIIGKDKVGILAGGASSNDYNSSIIFKSIDVQGTVVGGDSVGGIVGYANNFLRIIDFVFKGNVTGASTVGGIIGYNSSSSNNAQGIIYDTTITNSTGGNAGKVSFSNFGDSLVLVSSTTTKSPNTSSCKNGIEYTTTDISLFDYFIDTYIGGDTDDDHYYFDFDSNGVIKLYSTVRKTPDNRLDGSGTEDAPYLIKNTNDWKKATATIDGTNSYYYSIISDLDFTNKVFYPLGTKNNLFKGTLLGNYHTISNVTTTGYSNVGVFGNAAVTVSNLNFNNISITGMKDEVGIFGVNSKQMSGINVRNTIVTGHDKVGILAGTISYSDYNYSIISNLDIQGTVTGNDKVGGVVGNIANFGRIIDFVFKGNVTGNATVGGIVGYNYSSSNNAQGVIYDTTITNSTGGNAGKVSFSNFGDSLVLVSSTTTKSPNNTNCKNGKTYTTADIGLFDYYIDTYIGGDTNNDHYYFDLNSNGILTLYSTDFNPITVTLAGTGVQNDPYIINSTDDWKMATATIDGTHSYYYSITSDLDFTNKMFYPLGTARNMLKGSVDGNHHTISNITTIGYDDTGVFGKAAATVSNINFNNISITGHDYTGIFGENSQQISGIKVRNATITGNDKVGILIGSVSYSDYNTAVMSNLDIKGTVTGNDKVGGIVGNIANFGRINNFVFKGTVTGNATVGGIIGYNYSSSNNAQGVVYDSTITNSTGGNAGKVSFSNFGDSNVLVSTSTTKSPDNTNCKNGVAFSNITLEAVASVLDTTDSNGDGYSFTLTNGDYELVYSN